MSMVLKSIKDAFELKNDGYKLLFTKLMPSKIQGGIYKNAEIKKLRFVKRNTTSDIAGRYFGSDAPDTLDYEVSFTAKRKSFLGKLGELTSSMKKNGQGIIMHEGIRFDGAVAEVRIGNKLRRVGVFGSNTDAGVIDLSDDIERGRDGHPTFDSLVEESDIILQDFYNTIRGVSP